MKRFVHVKRKLLGTLGAVGYYALAASIGIPCAFKAITHLSCPGCGMTRAWVAALHGNLSYAFTMHPWFWSVPILYGYFLAEGKLLGRPTADRIILSLLLGGFAVVFLCRLFVPAWRV